MREAAINQIGINNCTGCYACYNVCECEAIEMKMTQDGFYKPYILQDRCVDCGVCAINCPVMNVDYTNNAEPDFFAAWSNNADTRRKSSSGGIFSEIAESILENGGEVYGVVWDKDLELIHAKINFLENLPSLRGSKYLQSKVNKSYKDIKGTLIKSEKEVLFVGTPCQVAGIKKIVNSKRLLTCDLICHGIPSYIPFKSCIDSMDDEIHEVDFRDKITGWTSYSISFRGKKKVKSRLFTKDKFFMGFLKDYYLNEACYKCKFSKLPRQGDITLGDFWGIDKRYDKNNEGVSIVIVNNPKGHEKLRSLEKRFKIQANKVNGDIALKSNPRICSGNFHRPKQRDYIINDIKKYGFHEVAQKEIYIPSNLEIQLRKFASYLKSVFITESLKNE